MTDKTINVLLLEDTKIDEALIKRHLLKTAPKSVVTVARNRSDFFEKIEWFVPDLILADYNLPDINGLEVLLHIREKMSFIPFIFITGALNDEEKAAEAILEGASGYVLKENLSQLPSKILEVLEKAEKQKAAAIEEERRWREAGLSVQKAMALLDKAPTFSDKNKIKRLLEEVLEAIQD